MEITYKLMDRGESEDFYRLINDNRSRLSRYFPNTIKEIRTKEDAVHHLIRSEEKNKEKEKYLFGIYFGVALIGYVNVKNFDWEIPKCELGYFMDEAFEGKGIMTKMVNEICAFCFRELKIIKIFMRIAKENIRSIRIAEKNGFIKEGTLRKEFRLESGVLIDVEYYGRISS